jgi:parallel beta-helix repeat protein
VLAVILLAVCVAQPALAAVCGGAVACHCGDLVGEDYAMTADLGPCPRLPGGVDTVGLSVRSGVTLDCRGHTIIGPGDQQTDSFGVRISGAHAPAAPTTVRGCDVTRFWWGVHVEASSNVRLESNRLYENGWKIPLDNGSGYGLDVANSTDVSVVGNRIEDNGNEGFHLSASSGVLVEDNDFAHNGMEQLYLINAHGNVVRHNRATGGTQGLELRYSNDNDFSYNAWVGSPLQWLENDSRGNTFTYEHFEGRVVVGPASSGNEFRLSEFANPTGRCLSVAAGSSTTVYKSYFRSCNWDVYTTAPVTLQWSVHTPGKVSPSVKVQFPGCTGDVDLDGRVGEADRPAILAAMGSAIGDLAWNPEADLDHDGDVDGADLAVFDGQVGPCAANLVVSALGALPAAVAIGGTLAVTDTVRNDGRYASGTSRTQYYLSLDAWKNTGDSLLGGRAVGSIAPGASASGTATIVVPSSTVPGAYFVLACADDTALVLESDEADNCRASDATLDVGRPDLVVTHVGSPPGAVPLGGGFTVSDTVRNQSAFSAGAARVRYYLSLDAVKGATDRLLNGIRITPLLIGGATSSGPVNLVVPSTTPAATYYVLACADDARVVTESDETNNCGASSGRVQVGRPDLVVTALGEPPAAIARGGGLAVSDTVRNQSPFQAGASRVQYYLSTDQAKNTGDRLLTGLRAVGVLGADGVSAGSVTVTVPTTMPLGAYYVLACADNAFQVVESHEANNCRASAGRVTVTAAP